MKNRAESSWDPDGEVLCIIPARGGSKGIPGKNVKMLWGEPLLAHTVRAAREAPSIGRVVVSTDDDGIAGAAERLGAEVVRRPPEISGDAAPSEAALLHVLEHLRDREGYEPALVVFLQATSPLRAPGAVQEAIDTLRNEGADSLFSACPLHGFVWRRRGGSVESFSYDYGNRPRRQDAGEDLVENGSIYVFRPWILHRHGNRLGGKIAVYLMDPVESLQIDEPADMDLMEKLAVMRK